MRRLRIFSSNVSKVLEPLPQGDLRTVTLRVFVGRRTGPLTLSFLSLERWIRSLETFSRLLTLRDVSVMRMRWITGSTNSSWPCLAAAFWGGT